MAAIASTQCWCCGAEIREGEIRCTSCSKIQPFAEGTDYFSCLGLKRLLNIDLTDLEKRFYQLSREVHPDFHHTKGQSEQDISLESSALLNKAYRTLKGPFSRAEYLIHLEEGNQDGIAAQTPRAFLEEVFALQEMLEEYRSTDDSEAKERLGEKLQKAQCVLQDRMAEQEKQLFERFEQWDQLAAGGETESTQQKKALVRQMKELLSHRSYIENLIEDGRHLLEGHADRRVIRH